MGLPGPARPVSGRFLPRMVSLPAPLALAALARALARPVPTARPQPGRVLKELTELGTNAAGAGDGAGYGEAARERDVRPPIAQGLPLQAYSDDQLDDLVSWIRSDGVERSEDEEVEQLRETLALKRRGTTVDAVLHHAVKRGRN